MQIHRNEATGAFERATVRRPSDFHLHLREGPMMRAVLRHQLAAYKYGLVMPNDGPVCTVEQALLRRSHVRELAGNRKLTRLTDIVTTVYHTALVTPAMVEHMARLWEQGLRIGVKHYPVHGTHQQGTTGSGLGMHLEDNPDALRAMEEAGIPLLVHAEDVEDKHGRPLDHRLREAHFVMNRLWPLRDRHPNLRLCVEHVSTRAAVEFIKADGSGRTVGTVTPQHMWFTRHNFNVSWATHLRCMPIVKEEEDREQVAGFAIDDSRSILGTDSAPHPRRAKDKPFLEAACGCFTPHALALYAAKFIQRGAMDHRFERFASFAGPNWWKLPCPEPDDTITIRAEAERDIPEPVPVPETDDIVIPLGWSTEPDKLKVGYALA